MKYWTAFLAFIFIILAWNSDPNGDRNLLFLVLGNIWSAASIIIQHMERRS